MINPVEDENSPPSTKLAVQKVKGRLVAVSRKRNQIEKLLQKENEELVGQLAEEFQKLIEVFQQACKAEEEQLEGEEKIEFIRWWKIHLNQNVNFLVQTEKWLQELKDVKPEDSASQVSMGSRKSNVSRASNESASRSQVNAVARRAELLAEKSMLGVRFLLDEEEFKLKAEMNKKRQSFELEQKIAQEEAKIRAMDDLMGIDNADENSGLSSSFDSSLGNFNPMAASTKLKKVQSPSTIPAAVSTEVQPSFSIADATMKLIEQQIKSNELLAKHQLKSTLPRREVLKFDGDPIKFQIFLKSFTHTIEEKTDSEADRLYFLSQYTTGKPQQLVQSCFHLPEAEGYKKALKLLKKRYGDDYRISQSHMEKLRNWPIVPAENAEELDNLAVFLTSCKNAMEDISYMSQLNHSENLVNIVEKLPFELQKKWRTRAASIKINLQRLVEFPDLVRFINEEAEILSDPVFGKLRSSKPRVQKTDSNEKPGQQRKENPKPRNFSTAVAKEDKSSKCLFCEENHKLLECKTLAAKPYKDRFEFVKKKRLCFGCLTYGHASNKCRRKMKCEVCQMSHPTLLHEEGRVVKTPIPPNPPATEVIPVTVPESSSNACCHTGAGESVSVGMVPVKIRVKGTDRYVTTYAALDSHSTAAFMSEKLLKQLNIEGRDKEIFLTTMDKSDNKIQTKVVQDLEVFDMDLNHRIRIPVAYSRPTLPILVKDKFPIEQLKNWPHLFEIPISNVEAEVGLLLGVNTPDAVIPLEVIHGNEGEPYAIRTKLGWSVSGPYSGDKQRSHHKACSTNTELRGMLEQLYNQEFTEISTETTDLSVEDRKWLQKVEGSIQLKNGHYEIGLPFKTDEPRLGSNKGQAIHRANSLKRKFLKNKDFYNDYRVFMENMIQLDYATKVEPEENPDVWFIPHHGVYHPKKPGKIRVVFDCSAKYYGESLNDKLYQGPDLTSTLLGVLLRFRQDRIAFMCDIEAMFYQVKLPEVDAKKIRFLWWPDGDVSQPLVEYKVNVHLFGAVSSPSCANFALRRTAEDNKDQFHPSVCETIKRNFYVDDCLKSIKNTKNGKNMVNALTELCKKGGFRLHKFVSNSEEILSSLPESERAQKTRNMDMNISKELPREKALGLEWESKEDKLGITTIVQERPPTGRNMLSVISSIYDPLGIVGPFVLVAKNLLQELSRLKCDWDDRLPVQIEESWKTWLSELEDLKNFKIPRCIKPNGMENIVSCQLHHFADASSSGYGAVSYIRYEDEDGNVDCSILMGKSRCAPLKYITIPRLELSAAVLATKMDELIKKEMDVQFEKSYYWTDSTTVLKYIYNESKRFHTFVANRIQRIRDRSEPKQWNYVNTTENPADLASRGVSAQTLLNNSLWTKGPSYLSKMECLWPPSYCGPGEIVDDDPEVKTSAKVNIVTVEPSPIQKLIEKYSTWHRLLKAIAWILRIKGWLLAKRKKNPIDMHYLKTEDLLGAELAVLKFIQELYFEDELARLKSGKCVRKTSPLYKLSPFLKDEIIRVGGRLKNASLEFDSKHPIIVPKGCHVDKLLVRDAHNRCGHLGRNSVLCKLRENYWIIGANTTIRSELHSCVLCRKYHAKRTQQLMSELPSDRVNGEDPPFSYVGIDYFGPFFVKSGRKQLKKYGCIFTCLNIRAVHIEVADSLSTDSFINAMRRFIARRGQVKEFRSDNGTNLVAGCKELNAEIKAWNMAQINEELMQKKIVWKFNPPAASHFGGVWERQIRTIRQVFSALLKEQILDGESLCTLMCEVEAIINGRPLTPMSGDISDLSPITPNHILQLRAGSTCPPGVFSSEDHYIRKKWKQVQYLADVFWKRWKKEYVSTLQVRQKWNEKKRNMSVNDLVLVVDDNAPRNHWLLGRIIEVFVDKYGVVRSCNVKTSNSVLHRPIGKLCLIKSNDELLGA